MEKKEPKSQAKIRIPVPYRHWKILARRARNTKEFSAYLIRNRGIWRLGQTQEGQKTIFHRNDPLKRPLPWSKKGLSFLFLSQPTLTERQRLILFETLHNFKFLPRGRQRSLLEFLTQPTMDVAHPRAIVKPRKKEKHRSILDFIQPMEET